MLLSGFIENQPKTHEQYLVEINKNTPNTATLAAMDAAEKDEDSYGPFDDVSALMEALNAWRKRTCSKLKQNTVQKRIDFCQSSFFMQSRRITM